MEQFTKLIEFRQAVYDQGLTRARDAQFELLDALLLSPPIRSFPELSLSPVFRRQWSSAYAAIEEGKQNPMWLEGYLIQQIPRTGLRWSESCRRFVDTGASTVFVVCRKRRSAPGWPTATRWWSCRRAVENHCAIRSRPLWRGVPTSSSRR